MLAIVRKLLFSSLFLILIGAVLSTLPGLRVEDVSAAPISPYIMVQPEQTLNSSITPGMNYTIAVYTDYAGSDIWGWELGLTFNPDILQGLEVLNGDLITTEKNTRARFEPGTFDNVAGSLTGAAGFFNPNPLPAPVTSGPGTLTYVTFIVVGTGISDIMLGTSISLLTSLSGWGYYIIDSSQPPGASEPPHGVDHIGHGSFNNIPYGHDVAVTNIVAPASAILGDNVAINVTVANEGSFTETFNLTVTANSTQVGNQTVTDLESAQSETLTFIWNTTGTVAGNYMINATAWLTDMDPSDNNRTATIEVRTLHDVAITNLQIPSGVTIGDLAAINVTVANQGTFLEDINLTITYQLNVPSKPPPVKINTTLFQLAERPAFEEISVDWNTAGLVKGSYKINATITIAQDEAPGDNTRTAFIPLEGHDISVTEISATSTVFVGEPVTITVTVKNLGSFEETFDVTVTYGPDKILIDTQQVMSLAPETSTTLTFAWDTTGVATGLYTVNATAVLSSDINLENNNLPDTVLVATPTGHIAGTVEDASTGDPIEDVQVSAGDYFAFTDADGHYNITNVPTGTHIVTASKSGFQTSTETNINVVARQTTALDFALTPLPTTGTITGTVTDANGTPIEGVNVTISGHSDTTDGGGQYIIADVPAGTYTVTASKDGYETYSNSNVVVTAGQTTTLNFELTQKPQDITLYAAIGIIVIIVLSGIAIYLLRTRKAK
jgi:hypothetical protein